MRVSRRTFLQCAAAIPFAAHFGSRPFFTRKRLRVAVIGAGAFGGWTALHLARAGADVTVIDRWGPGNALSSSGGRSRVIRSIYGGDRIYSEMVKRAYELWDDMAASTGQKLYVETGALWMLEGDDAYVRAALPIVRELGFPVDELGADEAHRRYPQIDLTGVKSLWLERRAGALFARDACRVVEQAFEKAGGKYVKSTAKPGRIAGDAMKSVELADGTHLKADAYVFACGPWLGQLFPDEIGEWIRPTRQEVFYFAIPNDDYLAGHLPIWIDFGQRIVYGIPGVDGRSFKVADDTRGATIDPTTMKRTSSAEGLDRARKFLAARFPALANAPLQSAEVCQYENSPDGHLILDRHPHASNVWLAGGGSGHGFKLSPAVGEMIAQQVIAGKETPHLFRLDRLKGVKRKTQFET